MSADAVWAVVPVKPFDVAKIRLGAILSPTERSRLARSMLEDVLDAVTAHEGLAGVIIVTRDADAAALAKTFQADTLAEATGAELNGALATAVSHLSRRRVAALIVVPSDIPHLSAGAIDEVVGGLSAPRAVALVPAINDGGTNMLACRPANAIAPSFGHDSFRRHCQAARRAGIELRVVARADVGRDLDRPEDLAEFLALESATRTHAFLSELGIAARLQQHASACRGLDRVEELRA